MKPDLLITIQTLLGRGATQREIERFTGVDRKTIRRYQRVANSPFVMTLKFSGKRFRKVVWKTSQEIWARLHEEAFRAFGGCVHYVVLDNLKEGAIRPDLYEPALNPVYAAMLAHHSVVADPCRVREPNRKGTVENAIQHTQSTALKGRKFDSIEAQNEWLAHWAYVACRPTPATRSALSGQ